MKFADVVVLCTRPEVRPVVHRATQAGPEGFRNRRRSNSRHPHGQVPPRHSQRQAD